MLFYGRHLRPLWIVSISMLILVACQPTVPPSDPATAEQTIRDVLVRQVEAWNAGDIDTYMAGYQRSEDLRFASGGSVQHGWQTTLERYHRSYPDRAAMGQLTFADLDIQLLHETHALVFGRWQLQRGGDYADIGGLFTLIFEYQQEEQAWRIVHDHTSTADE